MMKKNFNKKLEMAKEYDEDFENYNICWIYDFYADGDVKVRDHCHITGKYRGCNIHIKLTIHWRIIFGNVM